MTVWMLYVVTEVVTNLVLSTVVVIGLALNNILYSWVSVSVKTVLLMMGEVMIVVDGIRGKPAGRIGGVLGKPALRS